MIDLDDIEYGQVFQPDSNNPNDLIKYCYGQWRRSNDAGKTYFYNKSTQDQNKADALAPESIRIVKQEYGKITHRLDKEEWNKKTQELEDDRRKPLSERNYFRANEPITLIAANSSTIDADINDALETGETKQLLSTVRMLLRDLSKDNPEFDAVAYVTEISQKVTVVAESKAVVAPHLSALFRHSRAVSIRKAIATLVNASNLIQLPESAPNNEVPVTAPPPPTNTYTHAGFDTYIKEEYRDKLMPYLISIYTNKKPRVLTPMLYALDKLEVLTCKVSKCDQTNLHNALAESFGEVGGRTGLNAALPLYDEDSADSVKKQIVEQHKKQIKTFLNPK